MNNTIANPIGIDAPIQRMQDYLYSNLNWSKLEMFGRVQKNNNDGKPLPQPFLSTGQYLRDAYLIDKNNAHVFFLVDDKKEHVSGSIFKVEVKTVFSINLKTLFPSIAHRADTEAQSHAFNLVSKKKAYKVKRIETGIKTVLNGFDIEGLNKLDIQPFHLFAIVSEVQFKINPNC